MWPYLRQDARLCIKAKIGHSQIKILWRNFGRNLQANPNFHQPSTRAELKALLAAAAREGRVVRVVGASHSFSPLCMVGDDDNLISLDAMNKVLWVDASKQIARVEAGIRLNDLNKALHERGFALPSLGEITKQSIAGAQGRTSQNSLEPMVSRESILPVYLVPSYQENPGSIHRS